MQVHDEHVVRVVGELPACVARASDDRVDETGVPVIDGEQVMKQRDRPNEVRVVRVPLSPVEEHPEAVDLYETETPKVRPESDGEVEDVQRQQTQTVDVERHRVHVVYPQFNTVRLKHPVQEIAAAEPERYVAQVHEVGRVVEHEPQSHRVTVDLLEGEAEYEHPEVIDEGDADDQRPPVGQAAGRVEHERPAT